MKKEEKKKERYIIIYDIISTILSTDYTKSKR